MNGSSLQREGAGQHQGSCEPPHSRVGSLTAIRPVLLVRLERLQIGILSLAHLAVGLMSDQIKVGSMARSERTAKWNEMLRIEEVFPAGALKRFRPARGA